MRITNSTIMRGFDRNMMRTANLKTESMNKIMSGRSFSRASENPLSAAKALNVRKSLYYTAQYTENLKVADKFYTEAETSLLGVSEKLQEIRETLVAACNTGIKSIDEYNIYAQQLETKAIELCKIFNTDSAGRAIFGGCSDNGQPFEMEYDENGTAINVLYHGVPLDALSDAKAFPYSSEVLADIGLGLNVDQETHVTDPQSGLRISFNGPDVSGCGSDSTFADIDFTSIKPGLKYSIQVYHNNVTKTVEFTGGANGTANAAVIEDAINKAFKKDEEFVLSGVDFKVTDTGVITTTDNKSIYITNSVNAHNKLDYHKNYGYSDRYMIPLDKIEDGKTYRGIVTVGDVRKTIEFAGAATDAQKLANIQAALDGQFLPDDKVTVNETGVTCEGKKVKLSSPGVGEGLGIESMPSDRCKSFSNNYIQITLDAAKALRDGNIDYANACIDRIVSANEKLLVEVANLGCNEDFIQFSLDRMTSRDYNLKERQTDLEATDLEKETTALKTYTAMYNACLQLASEVVPQTIFNFMR